MIYVIEGQDNVGKSSQIKRLTKYLANKHRFPLNIHCSSFGLPKNQSQSYSEMYYYKLMKEVIRLSEDIYDVILDRSWLGEYVYSPLYRGDSGEYVFEIEKILIKPDDAYGFRLITLVDSSMKNLERDDGDSFSIDPEMKKKEMNLFIEAHERSTIEDKLLIDIRDWREFAVWDQIETFISSNVRS